MYMGQGVGGYSMCPNTSCSMCSVTQIDRRINVGRTIDIDKAVVLYNDNDNDK